MSRRGVTETVYLILAPEERIELNIEQDAVVALVDDLLYRAIACGASDVHLQPSHIGVRVRFRIDGFLYDQRPIPVESYEQIVSRIKIISGMDISEKRLPQDGKCKICINLQQEDKELTRKVLDVRVATFPSLYGEKIVLRLLDRDKSLLTLPNLGLSRLAYEQILRLIREPHGLFLTTGPTGSGKTTTLYAILSLLNKSEKNIVTMEDPIEYELDGITQSQVNDKAGFSFENGLRSLLRQDPDIMMVGEIRDVPTMNISIEAALTGHLVVSTLHTNNAIGAINRLLDMGAESFLLSASVIGVVAQRLARVLCLSCKREEKSSSVLQDLSEKILGYRIEKVYSPVGCRDCFKIGYRGRTGIFELLVIDDHLREKILQHDSSAKIKDYAQKIMVSTFLKDALEKLNQGIISEEELFSLISN